MSITPSSNRSIPGLSIDTKTLEDKLRTLTENEIITYQDLTSLIGRDVTDGARSNLMSARSRLLNEGIVIACVRGVGVKRINDTEKIGEGLRYLKKIRRGARKTAKVVAAVEDFQALPKDLQIQHNLTMSVLGLVTHMTKASTIKQLEGKIDQEKKALPVARTLDALK